jgi:hypothetical protein
MRRALVGEAAEAMTAKPSKAKEREKRRFIEFDASSSLGPPLSSCREF